MKLLEATKVNQWKKTKSSIEWFKFGLMLNLLSKIYHDDGLAVLKNENRLQSEQIKKYIQKILSMLSGLSTLSYNGNIF